MLRRTILLLTCAAALAAGSDAVARGASVCASGCYSAPAGSGALFVFSGHGWGHGVGMSQYGAYGYALHGASYQQILAHYYPGTSLGPAPSARFRVLLADRKARLTLASEVPFTVRDGTGLKVSLPAGAVTFGPGLAIGGQKLAAPLTFLPGRGGPLTLTRPYRGQIQVDVVDGKLRAVNVVGLEQYLLGVVPSEMPSAWAAQALDAQAVASRSYALATRKVGAPYDAYSDTRSQMYLGLSAESSAATAAVRATKSQILSYGGKVATTFFSSTSGGATESSVDWTGTAVPYLVSVPDPYDSISPYHNWGPVPVTAQAIGRALKVAGPDHRRDDRRERGGPCREADACHPPRPVDGSRHDAQLGTRAALDVVHRRRAVAPGAGAGDPVAVRVASHAQRHGPWRSSRHARAARDGR